MVHLTCSLTGWNRKLTDNHSFRQTQTAISTYYTLQDGFHLAYETPVLGKPWSIPLEFPLFQWIVAAAVLVFKTPLDQTGRFWSLLFFYLSLFPLYSLLSILAPSTSQRQIIIGWVLLNPIYLFWPSTFLIESLALFLSLLYLFWAEKALRPGTKSGLFLFLTSIFGVLAGIAKITTFLTFCLPCACLVAWAWWREGQNRFKFKSVLKHGSLTGMIFIPPLAASWAWVRFEDIQKSLNPLANHFITSNALTLWNFGTWAQRMSADDWRRIFMNSHLVNLLGDIYCVVITMPLVMAVGLASMAFPPGKRAGRILCFAFYFFPLWVFTNLFIVHDYYFFENNIFLIVFLGLALFSASEKIAEKWRKYSVRILVLIFAVISFADYLSAYGLFKPPSKNEHPIEQISSIIEGHTNKTDVLLTYGLDWAPLVPYYSHRRAIMDRWKLPLNDPRMKQSLDNLGDDRIGAMLILGPCDPGFIQERIDRFKLDPKPLQADGFYLYIRKSSPQETKPSKVEPDNRI